MKKIIKNNKERILIKLYIIILILEAPIRYILNLNNINSLIYIKDIIMILLLLMGLRKFKFNTGHFVIFFICSISFAVANIYIKNIQQIFFFCLKFLLPFLVGVLQYKNILEDMIEDKKFYEICFWITAIGVILNLFIEYPWEGLKYDIGNYTVSASWMWSALGQKRLGGFTRASTNAASYIMIFAILIQMNKENGKLKKIIYCIITFYTIWITTTKGLIVTSVIFYFITFFNFKINKKILINVLISFMIILPILSTMCDPIFEYLEKNLDYYTYQKYFYSFRERIQNVWPETLEIEIGENGNIFLGRGLGGIGTSQNIYEPDMTFPGDNMFVYLYVTFGMFSLVIFYYILKKVNKMRFKEDIENYIYNILLVICSYGIVVNIVEGPLLCILFGSCIGYMLKQKRKEDLIENTNS